MTNETAKLCVRPVPDVDGLRHECAMLVHRAGVFEREGYFDFADLLWEQAHRPFETLTRTKER